MLPNCGPLGLCGFSHAHKKGQRREKEEQAPPVASYETENGYERKVGGNSENPMPCSHPHCGPLAVCGFSHLHKGCRGFQQSGVCPFPGHCQFGCANTPAAHQPPAGGQRAEMDEPAPPGVPCGDASAAPTTFAGGGWPGAPYSWHGGAYPGNPYTHGAAEPPRSAQDLAVALAQCASLPQLHLLCARASSFSHEHVPLAIEALARLVKVLPLLGEGEVRLAHALLARAWEVAGELSAWAVSRVLACVGGLGVPPAQEVLDVLLARALHLSAGSLNHQPSTLNSQPLPLNPKP